MYHMVHSECTMVHFNSISVLKNDNSRRILDCIETTIYLIQMAGGQQGEMFSQDPHLMCLNTKYSQHNIKINIA